jgi:hypothetical protein
MLWFFPSNENSYWILHTLLLYPVRLESFFFFKISFQNLVFRIYLNFQQQKSLKNQYLLHSESKSYQITPIESLLNQDLSNNTKCTFQSLKKIQLWFHLIFNEKIIPYSRTFAPQVQTSWNQSPCTPPHRELSKDTENTHNLKHSSLVDLIITKQK